MTVSRLCCAAALALLTLAAGCNSQDDNIDTPVVRTESSGPAGIYEGTMTSTDSGDVTDVTAFVDDNETFMLFDSTGALIGSGIYTTVEAARSINWSARLFTTADTTDDTTGDTTSSTTITTLTAQGSYEEQASILVSYSESSGDSGTLSLTYDETAYETRSDVSLVQGTWGLKDAYGAVTSSITVDSGGSFSGSDDDDCTYSGSFTIVNQHYNLYDVTLDSTCSTSTTTDGTTTTTSTSSTTTGLATIQAATTASGTDTLVAVSASTKAAALWQLKPL
ncbi:hypothetical protein [Solimonas marina]|uniref:Lipoprotein n=1 Tax=Solimonas marina TaxID=2714601 RepID=A0A970B5T5_9GAMM|nr:hypothetical protein [Solimonas marina]NKF23737.1 hypothetical protein [Solimonas marina]